MKPLALIALLLIVTSCSTTHEVRRANRAEKKLERLVNRFPELRRTDTLLTKVSIRTPQISGQIIRPLPVPADPEVITLPGKPIFIPGEVKPFSVQFDDSTLTAQFSFDGNQFALDYTVKSMPVDTIIRTIQPTIQPTRHVPLPLKWWQKTLMVLGTVFIIVIMFKLLNATRPI